MRLRSARHEAFGPVANISLALEEEQVRLNKVNLKLAEKRDNFSRAVEEYKLQCGVLSAARHDADQKVNSEHAADEKTVAKFFDTCVNSWKKNVEVAHKVVGHWESKSKHQTMVVAKVSKELATAQAKYSAECEGIDAEFNDLKALSIFLTNL